MTPPGSIQPEGKRARLLSAPHRWNQYDGGRRGAPLPRAWPRCESSSRSRRTTPSELGDQAKPETVETWQLDQSRGQDVEGAAGRNPGAEAIGSRSGDRTRE